MGKRSAGHHSSWCIDGRRCACPSYGFVRMLPVDAGRLLRLSKAHGELIGRMYWFKHGVENVNVRIGSSLQKPIDARMLSTYLSFADIARLCERATLAEKTGSCVIWGASANSRSFWGNDARAAIGWEPLDSGDLFAGQLEGKVRSSITRVERTRRLSGRGRIL